MDTREGFYLLVLVSLAGIGCRPANQTEVVKAAGTSTAETAHEHEHKAPHGGTLVELGEEFAHIELVLDQATGQLTAYALDGEAENSVRLSQKEIELTIGPVTIKLLAMDNPLTGEKIGDTSEFRSRLGALKAQNQFTGTIKKIQIKGQSFESVPVNFPGGNDSHA
ncbi:MAG: hypothetical protein KCHDKBKB_02529 [Elusimicrobia bacterium]|nr:hypothetical protein [Elusimicrobiota bacterium]